VNDRVLFRTNPPCLLGSRDEVTGAVYFPPRALTTDGSLRECVRIELSSKGTLFSWTRFAGRYFGQIDLPEGVRLQCALDDGAHEIGAVYALDIFRTESGAQDWRFIRD